MQKITLSSGVSVDTTTRFLDYCTDVREVVDLTNNFDAATYIANNKSSGDSWMSRLEKVSSVVGGELIHENDTLIYKLQDNVYHVIGLKKNVDKIELDYIEGKSFIIDRLGMVENYSVTEVVLGDGCIGIEGAGFKGLEKLEKVSIGKNVASGLSSSYFYTNALKTITIDEDNAYYTVLQGVVYNKALTSICLVPKRLTGSITIPNTVTGLGTEFAGSDITSINVGNGIESIGFEAFKSCKKLKQVSFGSSVRFIAVNALYLCDALEKVSVANKTNWFIRDDSISVEDMANYEFLIENLTSQDNSKYFYRSTQ
jgi:hypothetical protein